MSDHALICCAVRTRRGDSRDQRTEMGLVRKNSKAGENAFLKLENVSTTRWRTMRMEWLGCEGLLSGLGSMRSSGGKSLPWSEENNNQSQLFIILHKYFFFKYVCSTIIGNDNNNIFDLKNSKNKTRRDCGIPGVRVGWVRGKGSICLFLKETFTEFLLSITQFVTMKLPV